MKTAKKFLCCLLCGYLLIHMSLCTFATSVDPEEDSQRRLSIPVESNEVVHWPAGPVVGAESAILMEANTGTILYSKNIDARLYPASTTKILTTLVAIENSDLSEMVNFSTEAVFSIERASSNMGMDVGQSITMEQCLYGILVYSANEVANAVGEHIAGSIDGFVDMMNARATDLGCTNSHFVTTNGLHDDNHYTSARDLATIAREFFKNETLAKISGTKYYKIEPTDTQPDLIELYTHNSLTNGKYEYDGYIGGKTGYTSIANQTLVSCAERNGIKLICVVMKEDSPSQFTDTIALFDYGFQNFKKMNISENEKNYIIEQSDFFKNDSSFFGNNESILSVDKTDFIVVPNDVTFDDLTSELTYDIKNNNDSVIAQINYFYQSVPIGNAKVLLAADQNSTYDFESPVVVSEETNADTPSDKNIVFINVIKILFILLCIIAICLLLIFFRSVLKNYNFSIKKRRRRMFKAQKINIFNRWKEKHERRVRNRRLRNRWKHR